MINIDDTVRYNGYNYEGFYGYEEHFIESNITVGKLYIVLGTSYVRRNERTEIWYNIMCDNNLSYWVPSICFDELYNREISKLKYNLK
jgi:hypothetical protein